MTWYSIGRKTYEIWKSWFESLWLSYKVCFRLRSTLRFLNLKRFPRTRARVGEGWRRPRCKLHRHNVTPSPPGCHPPGIIVLGSLYKCVCMFWVNCCAEARRFHSEPRGDRHAVAALHAPCFKYIALAIMLSNTFQDYVNYTGTNLSTYYTVLLTTRYRHKYL